MPLAVVIGDLLTENNRDKVGWIHVLSCISMTMALEEKVYRNVILGRSEKSIFPFSASLMTSGVLTVSCWIVLKAE